MMEGNYFTYYFVERREISDLFSCLLSFVKKVLKYFTQYHTLSQLETKCFPRANVSMPGRIAQSLTCLATDACLTADPGVASSIPVRSHTFV